MGAAKARKKSRVKGALSLDPKRFQVAWPAPQSMTQKTCSGNPGHSELKNLRQHVFWERGKLGHLLLNLKDSLFLSQL